MGAEAEGEDGGELECFGVVEPDAAVGVVVRLEDGDEGLGCAGDADDEVAVAGGRGVEDAVKEAGGPGEGRAADVVAAGGAGSQVGEEGGGVLPGGLAYRLVDEGGNEFVERLSLVREGRSGVGEFRGEAGAAGGPVGVEVLRGAEVGVFLRVEEGDGGVASLRGPAPEEVLHLPQVGGVVVEGEGAVAPHGAEVVFVGEKADGAAISRRRSRTVCWSVCAMVSPCCARSINAHSQ
ncbi:hypothetical protein GCM10020256_66010 [Streptomyces thermocoprophilus]